MAYLVGIFQDNFIIGYDLRIRGNILHRFAIGGFVVVMATGCGLNSDISKFDLSPSSWAIAQGYPTLLPVDAFNTANFDKPNAQNLIARAANLRRTIRALKGPVISTRDRARLNAAITRREQG